MPTKPRRRRERPHAQTHCLTVYVAQSRLDNTPFYHLCELYPGHTGWHLCWCGCTFTERGIVGFQQKVDLGLREKLEATHVPL
jgi:hypothetical protein